jgi:hypothetical protein
MIRLQRGPEPAALAGVRDGAAGELARVRALAASTQHPSSKEIGTRYTVVAGDLWRAQHYKCAYCEGQEQRKRNDVEHFRPKGRIDAGGGVTITPGYWWLAWSWRNLLFSCRNCNQSPAKLDKFPVEPGSIRLAAEEEPPGPERPLLLDPYIDEPVDHVVFRLAKFRGRDRWGPIPRNGSLRGLRTIEILLLDRDDLLDLYEKHVRGHIEPEVRDVEAAIARADPGAVAGAWGRALRAVAGPRPFAALSHDALDALVPADQRAAWGLALTRP